MSTFGKPILWQRGRKTCCIYSLDWDFGTLVPPRRVMQSGLLESEERDGAEAHMECTMYGNMACHINQTLPGFRSSMTSGRGTAGSAGWTFRRPGRKTTSRQPTSLPSISAPHWSASQFKAARWLSLSPPPGEEPEGADLALPVRARDLCEGLDDFDARFARMLVIRTGIEQIDDSDRATRTSCPPPSRVEPSKISMLASE